MTEDPDDPRCGWQSDLPEFRYARTADVVEKLGHFVRDPGGPQYRAWRQSVPWLQRECGTYLDSVPEAIRHHAILEYELPRDLRRPDVLILKNGTIVVCELKGYPRVTRAALDQVAAYARDLRAYHREARDRTVIPVLVTPGADAAAHDAEGVLVVRPEHLGEVLTKLGDQGSAEPLELDRFLNPDAYAPLPTIVQAARDLFMKRPLPRIKRARANTDPALQEISRITHEAARMKDRRLVLLSGVPGAGKTLVGLQIVHAGWLDDLAAKREGNAAASPAVYLSGNGPLVMVLQHALSEAGGGGKTFVQPIKNYVNYYRSSAGRIPPEHLIVFDEAQRAHDADRVAHVHKQMVGESEPEHLLEFCSRIPEWSVLVALIGTGQAIHVGEEGGLPLWVSAVRQLATNARWKVHVPPALAADFLHAGCSVDQSSALNLDTEIRFHLASDLAAFVDGLLHNSAPEALVGLSSSLFQSGYRLLLTRSLDSARAYLRERYEDAVEARYGLLASSKDKWLPAFGVDNTFQTTKRLKVGPWYNAPVNDSESCCRLETVATEFSAQGLELDSALVAWGSDLLWSSDGWHMQHSRGTMGKVHDPLGLRKNVYRVLLISSGTSKPASGGHFKSGQSGTSV